MLSNYGENNVIIGERTYKCEEMELADEGFVGWDSTIWDMFRIDWVLLMSLRYNILHLFGGYSYPKKLMLSNFG